MELEERPFLEDSGQEHATRLKRWGQDVSATHPSPAFRLGGRRRRPWTTSIPRFLGSPVEAAKRALQKESANGYRPVSGGMTRHPGRIRSDSSWARAVCCLLTFVVTTAGVLVGAILLYGGVPRSYADIREYERALPQHMWWLDPRAAREHPDNELTEMEGFIRFPNHLYGLGLNNVLEEMLVTSHIAHLARRSYVFEDYVWSKLPIPFTIYDFTLRPSRIPLNAFIGGFVAGESGSFDGNTSHYRSVSSEYYDYVCPASLSSKDRVVLDARMRPRDFRDTNALIKWWVGKINSRGAGRRCVEIREGDISKPLAKRVVHWDFFMSPVHIRSLVPELLASPVLKTWKWSPLVLRRVHQLLHDLDLVDPSASASGSELTNGCAATQTIPNLLAIHLRRGDYKRHCSRLLGWGSGFMGFNLAQELPSQDAFLPPNLTDSAVPLEKYYMKRCLPDIRQVVERAQEVRRDWEESIALPGYSSSGASLTKVLILSNGWPDFLNELGDALASDGWDMVNQRKGGLAQRGDRDIGVAVDMALAERAEVFLGNGFSTLSGNIALFRLSKGLSGLRNRLL